MIEWAVDALTALAFWLVVTNLMEEASWILTSIAALCLLIALVARGRDSTATGAGRR